MRSNIEFQALPYNKLVPTECHTCRVSRPLPVAHFLLRHKVQTIRLFPTLHEESSAWFNGILNMEAELQKASKRQKTSKKASMVQQDIVNLLSMKVPVTDAKQYHNPSDPVTEDGVIRHVILGKLASCISALHIGRIAVMYFGYENHDIETLQKSFREDQWGLIFEILLGWQRRNPGPNQKHVSMVAIF